MKARNSENKPNKEERGCVCVSECVRERERVCVCVGESE